LTRFPFDELKPTIMRCRGPAILTTVVAAGALSLLVAGCGGGSPTSAASAATTQNGALAYSRCVRSHGVPRFPDPNNNEVIPKQTPPQLGVSGFQLQAAQRACTRLLPRRMRAGEAQVENPQRFTSLLAFARCMRHHGIPNFPDPTGGGQITHEMLANAQINPRQPVVLQTADACASVTHGVITKAIVARFAAGH
jgi:hypothetical protein